METKVNSFTETVNNLIDQVNISLDSLVQINKSLTTQDDTVKISAQQTNILTGDVSTVSYSIPSYYNVLNKVNSLSDTVDVFVKGEGVVLLNDGTYRQISTIPIAKSPTRITNVLVPTKFSTRNNWFFESMMFPQLIVSFDLKNKIDDRSDRVVVKRVIFDNYNDEETQWFLDNIVNNYRTYYDTINILTANDKKYWEDEETQDLPLSAEPYTGYFIITDKQTISGKEWFYLDSMNYGVTSDTPVIKNIQLMKGNFLRYENSMWKIDDIEISEKRVHLIPMIGLDHPTINNSFEIYTAPFASKTLNIPVGYNECNIIFLKGVNDDFNIIADDWSDSIAFYSNYLTIKDGVTTLENYYNSYVADFGRQMEGNAKEKFIPAYFGVTPDVPIFSAANFEVKQVNVQLNAALDTEAIKTTQTQIESTKTIINSLKNTISQQKAELVQLTNTADRADLQSKIDANNTSLSNNTVQYQSLVRSLATVAYENSAVLVNPKYRIQGFFDIPKAKGTPPQEVIQFEQAYRYLRLDNTGNPLNTFSYVDPSTGQTVKGVFSDWNIVQSSIKKKSYDSTLEKYVWATESISDGEEVNINQIDIPIQKGEKVQLKIRSISEAGWPLNPIKSLWSDPVIIEFPSNLENSDQIVNILNDSISEETTIKLDQTLSSSGMTTHIDDSVPNPNTGTGTYFKHQARNLSYDYTDKSGLASTTSTIDLQTYLDDVAMKCFVTVIDTSTGNTVHSHGTIAEILQELISANLLHRDFNFSNI